MGWQNEVELEGRRHVESGMGNRGRCCLPHHLTPPYISGLESATDLALGLGGGKEKYFSLTVLNHPKLPHHIPLDWQGGRIRLHCNIAISCSYIHLYAVVKCFYLSTAIPSPKCKATVTSTGNPNATTWSWSITAAQRWLPPSSWSATYTSSSNAMSVRCSPPRDATSVSVMKKVLRQSYRYVAQFLWMSPKFQHYDRGGKIFLYLLSTSFTDWSSLSMGSWPVDLTQCRLLTHGRKTKLYLSDTTKVSSNHIL